MFKQAYQKDNELIRAPEKCREEIMKMTTKTNAKRTGNFSPGIIAAACLLLVLLSVLPFALGVNKQNPIADYTVSIGDLKMAQSHSEIFDIIEQMNGGSYGGTYFAGLGAVAEDSAMREDNLSSVAANGLKESAEYSQTNTQVKGVDEADIIKTDGHYIYRLTGYEVVILDPENMQVVSRIQTGEKYDDMYPENIYVCGDRLAIIYTQFIMNTENWHSESRCGVMLYDITDRAAPEADGDFSQSGHIASSRLIGDYIYIISNHSIYQGIDEKQPETYIPSLEKNGSSCVMLPEDICILPEANTASYAVISSVNINDAGNFTDTQAVFGYGTTVYADTETILLSFTKNETDSTETQENGKNVVITSNSDMTSIIKYNISNGAISLTAQGDVPGAMLNQFSIDRYNGVIRVVTTLNAWTQKIYTDGVDQYEFENSTTNGLYTLDDNLNLLGKIDGLAEDERVYSVRFSGDTGYFVTFRQVDPLFAVDLSDPYAPKILSALKIPGFSQYMHPYADGLLLGLGMDADEDTGRTNGLKLSMFDVSDPANVTELHKLIMEESWSEALYEHKAVVVSAKHDIIAFPAGDGYVVFGYGTDGFYERFELDIEDFSSYGARGMFIGDSFYICSNTTLYRYSMTDFSADGSLTFAEETSYYFCK